MEIEGRMRQSRRRKQSRGRRVMEPHMKPHTLEVEGVHVEELARIEGCVPCHTGAIEQEHRRPFLSTESCWEKCLGLNVVSRRIASRIHEISDLAKALLLSLRAKHTTLRDRKLD